MPGKHQNKRKEPSVTRAYSEPWYIHNHEVFRTEAYAELWDTQSPRQILNPVKHLQRSNVQKLLIAVVVFANYDILQYQLFTFSTFFNLILSISCSKSAYSV